MAKSLTPRSIDQMKPDPKKRREVPDPALSGLYLVVQPSGTKSWAVRYRHGSKPRKMTLGKWPVLSLADARLAASKALAEVEAGNDPGAAKIAAKSKHAADIDHNSFSALLDHFTNRHLSKLKTGMQNKAALDSWALPRWKDRDARTITRRDIMDLLDDIMDEGKETTANRVRVYLSKFFGYLVERDVVEVSPVLGIKPPAKERSRERVMSDDEIRWFWMACEKTGQPWGTLGKLLLLTGQRLGEAAGMTDAEIDDSTWHLSAVRTKNGRTHDVPLSGPALDVLEGMERVKSSAGYVHTTNGNTPVSGYFKGRNNIAEHMAEIATKERGDSVEIPRWTFHDLRRTAATGMARLGIPVVDIEAVLNHVSGARSGVAGIYNRHSYGEEKRRALEAWARFVLSLVEGKPANVVTMEVAR